MIIAVDAAGGDHYPKNPVLGALAAIKEFERLTILLVGPKNWFKMNLVSILLIRIEFRL